MKIAATYSHLNGLEYLLVHKAALWDEIQSVIATVDATRCRSKVSCERRTTGKLLYSPIEMNTKFKALLTQKDWKESRVSYWVTRNERLIRKTLSLPQQEQKAEIESAGETPIFS